VGAMSNPLVTRWKQEGQVYCWRYRDRPRRYPGWNISADARGCQSCVALLDLLLSNQWSSQATIVITSPTAQALQAVNGPAGWSSATGLDLIYPGAKVAPAHWRLRSSQGHVAITLGESRLREIQNGMVDIAQGRGDWGAPNDDEDIESDQLLYFWPLVWARGPRP
jgi:hypothetical protein